MRRVEQPIRDGDPVHRLPDVGEHTHAVLEELGLGAAEIADVLGEEGAAA